MDLPLYQSRFVTSSLLHFAKCFVFFWFVLDRSEIISEPVRLHFLWHVRLHPSPVSCERLKKQGEFEYFCHLHGKKDFLIECKQMMTSQGNLSQGEGFHSATRQCPLLFTSFLITFHTATSLFITLYLGWQWVLIDAWSNLTYPYGKEMHECQRKWSHPLLLPPQSPSSSLRSSWLRPVWCPKRGVLRFALCSSPSSFEALCERHAFST